MKKSDKSGAGSLHLKFGASLVALSTVMTMPAFAQEADEVATVTSEETKTLDTIVVTGIRKSLTDAMDMKREAKGVMDAINAEDIGKFPNSNLAESLQRIPGVSIDRVNGEGGQITVRGFGPSFNQVTLNGRSLPTADVPLVGAGLSGDASGATGRAFDFSNLASEGVRALEVYKTGRANIASGGIGATVNIVTRRPLEEAGFQGSITAKGVHDTTVDRGDSITPELAGTMNWSNEAGTFGVGLFGSYSKRHSAAAGANSAAWEVIPYSEFAGLTNDDTVIENAPTDPTTLITLPRDSRYQFSEFSRERLNGQLVLQFAPSERMRFTTDYTFAVNEGREDKAEISNWFNRPFSEVVFDDSSVPTAVFLKEPTTNKGAAMQQTLRMTKDELHSFGVNGEFDVTDKLTIVLDAHSSKAEVSPNAPMGFTEINVGLDHKYGPSVSHGVDYSGDIPVMIIETVSGSTVVDTGLAASQVANGIQTIVQKNEVDQIDLHAKWELDDNSNLVFGGNYRTQTNLSDKTQYQQILGNWGAENPGDADALAPGALEVFCMSCKFEDHSIGGATSEGGAVNPYVEGVRGDAAELFAALSAAYAAGYNGAPPRPLNTTSSAIDEIQEDVLSIYAQFDTAFQIADRDAALNVGLRYESTDVSAATQSSPTAGVLWQGNNDFALAASSTATGYSSTASYDNFMPNVDFAVDVTDDMKVRASYSRTIARATYNNLFASDSAGTPSGPTALADGNLPNGSKGNPGLLPLEADNFDVSWEWYYGASNYVSIGAFEKRVRNFVGTETVEGNLFGLRDVSSGAEGTRSGAALGILEDLGVELNEDNFFAASVYVDQAGGDVAAAQATFIANQNADGNIDEDEYLRLETNFELAANATDPLMTFELSQPVNNREAKINGIEIQGQHFFGDTGFGLAGSYTMVEGDVGFDILGDPDVTQFALVGLSDTANATLIYEKYGFSGRLAYNWRDEFLQSANDGNRNPIFVEAYGQIDLSLGYEINDNLSVSFEGVNLNEERSRTFQRSQSAVRFLRENGARYYFGINYKF
ncbi:TonB-dependent receptor [Hirschia litorea]|uniref:TonB-dependent receptor n=1 Tax=Hirschia litorea TaxID=1199156 RepID=A0ABW2IP72_9PROT